MYVCCNCIGVWCADVLVFACTHALTHAQDIFAYASFTVACRYKLHRKIAIDSSFAVSDVKDTEQCKNGIQVLSFHCSFFFFLCVCVVRVSV